MQGNIWVVPNPQGFAQSMTLVLRFQLRESISTSITESGPSPDYPHSNSLFAGLKVLLVDSDDANKAVTRKLLEKLGCKVSTVSSGVECLSAFHTSGSSFQIVLLDLHMPGLDGFEVANKIRQFRSSTNWPVIVALTTSSDDDVWDRCLQVGINGVIRKPVLLHGMANELRRVLLQPSKTLL